MRTQSAENSREMVVYCCVDLQAESQSESWSLPSVEPAILPWT